MSVPQLSIVRADQNADSPAARALRLYAEAQAAALEQVRALEKQLAAAAAMAAEISEGGDIYPAGVRDLCRRISDDVDQRAHTLDAIAQRVLERAH